jgi:hypothetical protein
MKGDIRVTTFTPFIMVFGGREKVENNSYPLPLEKLSCLGGEVLEGVCIINFGRLIFTPSK